MRTNGSSKHSANFGLVNGGVPSISAAGRARPRSCKSESEHPLIQDPRPARLDYHEPQLIGDRGELRQRLPPPRGRRAAAFSAGGSSGGRGVLSQWVIWRSRSSQLVGHPEVVPRVDLAGDHQQMRSLESATLTQGPGSGDRPQRGSEVTATDAAGATGCPRAARGGLAHTSLLHEKQSNSGGAEEDAKHGVVARVS